jgi:SPP1 gp7 family putative phage head morphogenesis protein
MVDANLLLTYEKRKAVARVAKKRRGKPPVWLHPIPVERYYAGILLSYVRFMQEQTRQILYPALPGLEQEANNAKPVVDRADDYSDNVSQIMQSLSLSIDKNNPIPSIPTMTMDIGQKTSKWNSAQWQKTMKQVTGVNTAQYEPWIQGQLKSFSTENVALIKSLKDQNLSSIETMAQRSLRSGMRHEEIAKQIEGQYDTTRNRAKLIARDQVSKLNGQLTELRQKDIGINEYIWRTSGDERVRADHAANNGKKMRWDDPTVCWNGTAWVPRTGFRGIPGEDYQCRCWAEPVFDSVYESIDAGTYTPPPEVDRIAVEEYTSMAKNIINKEDVINPIPYVSSAKVDLVYDAGLIDENGNFLQKHTLGKWVNIKPTMLDVEKLITLQSDLFAKNMNNIAEAIAKGGLKIADEPIKVIKYYDNYFIHDGNHRAAVYKLSKIKQINAKVLDLTPIMAQATKLPKTTAAVAQVAKGLPRKSLPIEFDK